MFGALAEFERDHIRERTRAGLAAARARGRPQVVTNEKATIARQMYDSCEHTVAAIAAAVGVSRASIYRSLAATANGRPSARRDRDLAGRAG